MARYLIEASYTPPGAKGLLAEGGTSRRATITKMVESLGGKVESFDYAFGDADAYVIIDFPSHAAAVSFSLAVNQAGAVQVKTHVLLTPEEIDEATKGAVDYRPPGQ